MGNYGPTAPTPPLRHHAVHHFHCKCQPIIGANKTVPRASLHGCPNKPSNANMRQHVKQTFPPLMDHMEPCVLEFSGLLGPIDAHRPVEGNIEMTCCGLGLGYIYIYMITPAAKKQPAGPESLQALVPNTCHRVPRQNRAWHGRCSEYHTGCVRVCLFFSGSVLTFQAIARSSSLDVARSAAPPRPQPMTDPKQHMMPKTSAVTVQPLRTPKTIT